MTHNDVMLQPKRYLLEEWDHEMMARDKRITGIDRKQQVRIVNR